MTLLSDKYSYKDIVRFVYKEKIDDNIQKLIEDSIDASDIGLLEVISNIRVTMVIRKFNTAQEHIETINNEVSKIPLYITNNHQYSKDKKDSSIQKINTEEGNHVDLPSLKIHPLKKFKYHIAAIILLLIVSITFLLNRLPDNEVTRFVDNQLQTNELPTLPAKYETVLSTDDRPKELAKAYKDREYEKAITLIKEEQANPENEFIKSELDFILAVCYLRTGKNKKAIGLLKPITLGNSTYSSDAKLELSYAYIKTGDYKKAYDLSIDIKENSSSFYQKEAEETIKEILEFKPDINQN